MSKRYTERGFADYGRFIDTYGATVNVRQSSAAENDNLWIHVDGGAIDNNGGAIHLDRHMAAELISNLAEWLKDIDPVSTTKEKGGE